MHTHLPTTHAHARPPPSRSRTQSPPASQENHGKALGIDWLGSDERRCFIGTETALRSLVPLLSFMPQESVQKVSVKVLSSAVEIGGGKGRPAESMIDFDEVSMLVVEEYKRETLRNLQFLQARAA